MPIYRLYASIDSDANVAPDKTFYDIYFEEDPAGVRSFLEPRVPFKEPFSIVRPSSWRPALDGPDQAPPRVPELVVAFEFNDREAAFAHSESAPIKLYSDPELSIADHWCPSQPDQTRFGTRKEARRLIAAHLLGRAPLSGTGVHVVIVDQGLNKRWIDNRYGQGRFRGGWRFYPLPGDPRPVRFPGQTSVDDAEHGLMLVRNILDIAPDAFIYDLPLIPPHIDNISVFLDEAQAAYDRMLTDIYHKGGTWVLVNAWAVFDRRTEVPPRSYTENYPRRYPLHKFTRKVADAIDHGVDVIFCAGNCGEFCPDDRCGGNDRGRGFSIWGANSYYRVLTVGAVRIDGTWIGYSSQGPGQPLLGLPRRVNLKPDICTPSGFCEDLDAHTANRGTSAAVGLTAGVVAALRSKRPSTIVSPEMLQSVFNATARRSLPGTWDAEFGHGILDVRAALRQLP